MKNISLQACLLVAASVSGADLKSPAAPVQTENQGTGPSSRPPGRDLSLKAQVTTQSAQSSPGSARARKIQLVQPSSEFRSLLRVPTLYDAPSYRVPNVLPDYMPPGSFPLEFSNRTRPARIR